MAYNRKLTATWNFDPEEIKESKPKRPLTKEEEADEIVRRLATPPKRPDPYSVLEGEIARAISSEITKEIDEEILRQILNGKFKL